MKNILLVAILVVFLLPGCQNNKVDQNKTNLTCKVPEKLRKYCGFHPYIKAPIARAGFLIVKDVQFMFYPEGSPYRNFLKNQILLNKETKEYIYSAFTPIKIPDNKIPRPFFENVIKRILKPGMSEEEKVLTLWRWTRDIQKRVPMRINPTIKGGTEEEMVKRGDALCECKARILLTLCQLIKIPARIIYLHSWLDKNDGYYSLRCGHVVNEIYVNNHWAFFDAQRSDYFKKKDGSFASLWELENNRDLANQSEEVLKDIGHTKEELADLLEVYLGPHNAKGFVNYSIQEHYKYNNQWVWLTPEFLRKATIIKQISMGKRLQEIGKKDESINLADLQREMNDMKSLSKEERRKKTEKNGRVFLSLTENQVLTGKVTLELRAEGFYPNWVEFFIDGTKESVERSAPYICYGDGAKVDTTKWLNGIHTIKVTAADTLIGISKSINIKIKINN